MLSAPIPANDKERLAELYKYELLDVVYEDDFNDIVRVASQICNVPMSLITLIDLDRQWFKAKIGIEGTGTDRSTSFCGHAIMNDTLFEVPDTASDERFVDNPFVLGDPFVRYYAGMPLVTDAGYKIGTLCVLDNVPRKLSEEQLYALGVLSKQVIKLFELRLKNKELKRISEVQERIITILAHDIRNPLAALKSTVDLKQRGALTEELQKEINRLTVIQLDSTLDLLDNVVNWGQLQMSRTEQANSNFDLHDLCASLFAQFSLAANAKDNVLCNVVDPGFSVWSNKQAVEFILRNIISNANKFTEGGKISVTAETIGDSLSICVIDTGVGMSDKAKESLRQRKWTTTQMGTNNEKGSGVGLKLVYEYLQNIHGDIDYISAPMQGTTAIITLPVPGGQQSLA